MKIALLEPIGVSKEVIDELSAPITEKGHEFVYYDTKTTDPAELAKRSEGCDIVMIANNEQLLVYFLYRHVPTALDDGDVSSKAAFAVRTEDLHRLVK